MRRVALRRAASADGEGLFLHDVVTYTVIGEDGAIGQTSVDITLPNRGITLPNRGAPTHEGGDGSDHLSTGNGEDVVIGGDGDDTLYTRGGDDWLEAGAGNDRLVGGGGSDARFGSDGADAFDFYGSDLAGSGEDVIADFSFAEGDRLVFLHFDEGAFAGEFDHLQGVGAIRSHANA